VERASYMCSIGTANKVKILAMLPAAFGVYIIATTLPACLRFFLKGDIWPDILFFLPLMATMLIFGAYCIFVAYRTFSKVSVENVARLSLVAAIVLTFVVLALFGRLRAAVPEANKQRLTGLIAPLGIAAGGIVYLICKRFLLKWLELPQTIDWKRREKRAKQFFGWLAFFSFAPLLDLGLEFVPKYTEQEGLLETLWALATIVAAIIIAFAIYKAGVGVALRNRPTESEPEHAAPTV
jgi:undecaprenyl pyrophosphate phosphatase UppP